MRITLLLLVCTPLTAQLAPVQLQQLIRSQIEAKDFAGAVADLERYATNQWSNLLRFMARDEEPINAFWDSPALHKSIFYSSLEPLHTALVQRRRAARQELAKLKGPPDPYIAEGVCPGECCHYTTWTVLQPTPVYDRPRGKRVLFQLATQASVEALDGKVYVRPLPVLVRYGLHFDPPLKEGDIAFLLAPLGAGFVQVWSAGRIQNTFEAVAHICPEPGPDCWGEWIHTADANLGSSEWWARVRAPNGRIGWVNVELYPFDGIDGCAE